MKRKNILIAALAVFFISLIGVVYAHGEKEGSGNGFEKGYSFMHEELDDIFESGDYSFLEHLRDKYVMPMMGWIENENDFELAKQMHEQFEENHEDIIRGCHSW